LNIIDLIDDYKEAIVTNGSLLSWVGTTYNTVPTVYVDIDSRNPPGEDECPFCIIRPESKKVGNGITRKEHILSVMCCVYDSSERSQYQDNIEEYSSIKNLETFRQYVQDAITAVDISNALVSEIDISYETFETFPFLVSDMILKVIENTPMGGDFLV